MTSNMTFKQGYALLIGVDQHSVQQWALPDVRKDIDALRDVLIQPERCAYPADQVKVLTGEQATREAIIEGLEWLEEQLSADESEDTTAVIYYSGHGWHDDDPHDPTYYLIPYDTKQRHNSPKPTTALLAKAFAKEIERIMPQRLLVILDCCHAAGIDAKDLGTYTPSPIPSDLILPKGLTLSEGAKGLEQLQNGQGRAILNSSQESEKSYMRADGKMSIFTYHLIEALIGHAQPQGGATEVLVSDLLSHVHRRVPATAKAQNQEQNPDTKLTGNFPIALLLGGKGLAKGANAPDPIDSLNDAKQPGLSTVFNQSGQTVYGGQTNIAGDMNTGGGLFNMGSIDLRGSEVIGRDKVVQGDEVRGDKISRDKIGRDRIEGDQMKVGNISGSTFTIGRGSRVNTTSDSSIDEIKEALAPLYQVSHNLPSAQHKIMIKQLEALQSSLHDPIDNDEEIVDILQDLVGRFPIIMEAVRVTFQGTVLAEHNGPVTKYYLKRL